MTASVLVAPRQYVSVSVLPALVTASHALGSSGPRQRKGQLRVRVSANRRRRDTWVGSSWVRLEVLDAAEASRPQEVRFVSNGIPEEKILAKGAAFVTVGGS